MLVAEHISKKFAGIHALNDVTMDFLPGSVTAVIGENGAGKSTLMKILSGVYTEYEGRILYRGQEVKFRTPAEAQDLGIAIIHQELNLVPGLSITENLFLGREIRQPWLLLNKSAMREKTLVLLKRLRLDAAPETLVADLKVGQQQVVEIAKALLTEAEVIIMDEPSSAISESEVAVLFDIIADLKRAQKAVVYISHKLDELVRVADRYFILRDGKLTESGMMRDVASHDAIIGKMTGRAVRAIDRAKTGVPGKTLLSVSNLSLANPVNPAKAILKDISFDLRAGEITGIFGLMGAGRTDLLETILGLKAATSGEIILEGKKLANVNPGVAKNAGLVLVPEDRKCHGFVPGFDIRSNISLSALRSLESMGFVSRKKEQQLADDYMTSLNIKATSTRQKVINLSGGNQQKVVLARCLATRPSVLMLDEPTRGIDAGAKNEIYRLILELSASGMGILVVSSELPEILAISDRVLVMAEGELTADFPAGEATEDQILKAAIPHTI